MAIDVTDPLADKLNGTVFVCVCACMSHDVRDIVKLSGHWPTNQKVTDLVPSQDTSVLFPGVKDFPCIVPIYPAF